MDNVKQDKQSAFKIAFERLDKSITINKDLIQACENKSSLLCGPIPSDMNESMKEKLKDAEPTIIDSIHGYCDSIEKNNTLLRQVLAELNNAI